MSDGWSKILTNFFVATIVVAVASVVLSASFRLVIWILGL